MQQNHQVPEGVTLSPERQALLDAGMEIRLHPTLWNQGCCFCGEKACALGWIYRVVDKKSTWSFVSNYADNIGVEANKIFYKCHGDLIPAFNDAAHMTASKMADLLTEAALHGLES